MTPSSCEYDFAAGYRMHADRVANGELAPTRALLIEIDADGFPQVYIFGRGAGNREVISALLSSAAHLNANASN